MSDPFDALRLPPQPEAPDEGFAASLRARLERALATGPFDLADLSSEEEPVMTAPTVDTSTRRLTPYLVVADARAAIVWYVQNLGAQVPREPIAMPDGRIGHAELTLGDERLMLADEYPEMGLLSPASRGGTAVSLHLSVAERDDVDRVVERAVAAGASLERPVADSPYGRNGVIVDPSGHRWFLMHEGPDDVVDAPPAAWAPGPGDVGYLTITTPDTQRFRDFYGPLLGWEFSPGRVEDGWHIAGVTPISGVHRGDAHTITPLYHVADLDAALAIVRDRGGVAGEADQQPYGLMAECTDDQGATFYLLQV